MDQEPTRAMFNWWNKRRSQAQTASEIYGAIVARARNPMFYRDCGVADTPEGRYELIVLFMVLVLDRLRQAGPDTLELQRQVIETFVTDMDDSMREMGVGDLTVPKRVKKAAAGLLERMELYRKALAESGDDALQAALDANIPAVSETAGGSALLARAVRTSIRHLAGLADNSVTAGQIQFSDEPL
jgi:cytochrome b pre-mRNA-processing protein 3